MSIRSLLGHTALVRVCQIAMGVIFGWAALAKIGDPAGFATQLHHFRLVPVPLENLFAVTLPWIELVAAVALLVGVQRRAAALLVAALMVVFTVAVGLALARGLDIECGCFGTADASRVGVVKLLQNTGMVLASIVAIGRGRPEA